MTLEFKKAIESTIETAQNLLRDNDKWRALYKGYADAIEENLKSIESKRELFRERKPLYFYINTTQARSAGSRLELDVRYMGQSVATLKCKNEKVYISTYNRSKGGRDREERNKVDFDCDIVLPEGTEWRSPEASKFRSHFENRNQTRNDTSDNKGNREHFIESLLLGEFKKPSADGKQLPNIQPVKIAGIRFAMPTFLAASEPDELRVAKKGGGIDILTHVGKGPHVRLCVIELKDENNAKEPPEKVLRQAVAYAVFLRELLRSESGPTWWEILEFSNPIPDSITIDVACAMPSKGDDETDFAGSSFPVGDDKIECHYIYFRMNEDDTELEPGSMRSSLQVAG